MNSRKTTAALAAPSTAVLVPLSISLLLVVCLTACGGGGDSSGDSGGEPGGGETTMWWNVEERQPAGAGAYVAAGIGPVMLGATTWVGAIEIEGEGVLRSVPDATDPDRSEIICSTISAALIECLTTEYDMNVKDYTEEIRATPGATAPTGTWTANAGFFPDGVMSTEAFAEYDGAIGSDLSINAYVQPGAGFEARTLDFTTASLVEGVTYTIPGDLFAAGLRFRYPLVGAATQAFEIASAGTLTITTVGTTLGARVAGTYNLTFPSGTATGSFDANIIDVD
jgi:hypothetical protein